MQITSLDFLDGEELPMVCTCQGEGKRPDLKWSGVSADAKTLAITLVDPDAPGGDFVHWVAINIPETTITLASDEVAGEELTNSSGKIAYVAPCPPSGKHRYIFTLYVLDADRLAASSYESFLEAAKPHIIDKAVLTGFFGKE